MFHVEEPKEDFNVRSSTPDDHPHFLSAFGKACPACQGPVNTTAIPYPAGAAARNAQKNSPGLENLITVIPFLNGGNVTTPFLFPYRKSVPRQEMRAGWAPLLQEQRGPS